MEMNGMSLIVELIVVNDDEIVVDVIDVNEIVVDVIDVNEIVVVALKKMTLVLHVDDEMVDDEIAVHEIGVLIHLDS